MRKQANTLLFVLVFLFYGVPDHRKVPQAAETEREAERALGLREAVEMALRTLDRTGPEIARWRVKEEQGRLWPELSLQGRHSFDSSALVSGDEGALLGVGDKVHRSVAELVLSYNLLQFLESRPRLQQAGGERQATEFRFRDQEGEAILRASDAYLVLLARQNTLKALESLRREHLVFMRQQEAKFREELISPLDMVRVQADLVSLNREILAIRGDIALAELNVRRLTRLDPEAAVKLAFNPGELDLAFIKSQGLAGLLALARDANPRLLADQAAVNSARFGVEAAQARRYPSLVASATGGMGRDQITGETSVESSDFRYGVFLRFSLPLFDGGVRRAQIHQAALRLESELSRSNQTLQDVKTLIEEEYWSFVQREEEKALLEQQVRLAKDELEQTRARVQSGLPSTSEVAGALSRLVGLEKELARLEPEVFLRGIRLALAVGRSPFTPAAPSLGLRLEADLSLPRADPISDIPQALSFDTVRSSR